jgi:putative aminopeptidase FrvX
MSEALALLQELVSLPGPPGQEELVAKALCKHLDRLKLTHEIDAKGNLLVRLGSAKRPKIVVTAHMDEIAMIVRRIEADGSLSVGALGGLYPWKIGEGPVEILAASGAIDGVLSFGSIHTASLSSTVRVAESSGLDWDLVCVFTGMAS